MNTQVLIVGAGPTGLMMAAQLQRWGIDFIIIDNKPGPTENSKALAVQARSMEIYRQMGLADKAVQRGAPAKALNLVVKDRVRGRIPFLNPGKGLTPYPYLLMLEQSKNERLLDEELDAHNNHVRWQHTLERFTENGKSTTAFIKDKDGNEYQVEARYIVAADGAKSTIRHQLQIPFTGATYEHIFFVTDAKVQWKLKTDEVFIMFSSRTFSAFFPMAAQGRFRVVGTLPKQFTDDDTVKFEDIEATIRQQMDIPVAFSDVKFFSVYRVHHRVVHHFREGNIFLAGDAAHVHSPVGAQGMNTGLQDAYNLAWKMAWVLKGYSGDALLDSYNDERHKIATILVKTTDQMFSLVANPSLWARIFRFYIIPTIVPLLLRINVFKRKVFKLVSQIAVKYPQSTLSQGKVNSLAAGARFPFVELEGMGDAANTFDLFKNAGLYLVSYKMKHPDINTDAAVPLYQYEIPVNDANTIALSKAGFSTTFVCVVRPDTYIGYISNRYDEEEIQRYLKAQLHML